MAKKRLNLTVDENLLNEARQHGINLSSFLEIKLREYLALINMGSGRFELPTFASSRRRHNP